MLKRGLETGYFINSPDFLNNDKNSIITFSQEIELPDGWYVLCDDGKQQISDFTSKSFTIMFPDGSDGIKYNQVVVFDGSIPFEEIIASLDVPTVSNYAGDDEKNHDSKYFSNYTVSLQNNKIIISYDLPSEWLLSKERVFPVYVDPTVELLSGFGATVSWPATSPYSTGNHDTRYQSLFLSSEIYDAGLIRGAVISDIRFVVAEQPGRDVTNFRIRLKNSSVSSCTTWETNGWTTVYGPANIGRPAAGFWYIYPITQEFKWNGSNLFVDVSRDNTAATAGGRMGVRGLISNRAIYGSNNSTQSWPFDNMPITAFDYVPMVRLTFTAPITQFHNYGGGEQIVFDNSYISFESPIFRVSSAEDADRVYVEISTCPDFSQMSSFQEFKTGPYTANTEYDFDCNLLTPALSFEANMTYYVRAKSYVSGSWTGWSTPISFTYKSFSEDLPTWHQTTSAQFKSNINQNISANNNLASSEDIVSLSRNIVLNTDDAHNGSLTSSFLNAGRLNNASTTSTSGFRFQNIDIPQGSEIVSAKLFVSSWSTHNDDVRLGIFLEKVANPATYSTTSYPNQRLVRTSTVQWWHNQTWFEDTFYSTPELNSIVQEVVDLVGWQKGNSISVLLADDGTTSNWTYREMNSFDWMPSLAARFMIKFKNDDGGNITSQPIALASFHGATQWEKLYWSESGATGDFRVNIETSADGDSWIASGMTNLDFNSAGHDISSLSNVAFIRLVGTFTGNSGDTPFLVDWTVSCQDISTHNADLLVNIVDYSPSECHGALNSWRIILSNNGPNEASGIVIDVTTPAALSIVDHSAESGVFDGSKWYITSLQVDEAIYLDFTTETIDVSVSPVTIAVSVDALNQTDPELVNNTATYNLALISNNTPTITSINNITTAFNTPSGAESFTLGDAETPTEDLILTAVSSNTDLIPNGNIVFGGSGANRTISFIPGDFQFGTCTITVTVSDGQCSTTTSFDATVLRHTVSSWTAASLVIGQNNFTTNATTVDEYTAVGASSSHVSPKGVLAVGSQPSGRVLIWNTVPTTDGVAANAVIGKPNFTDNTAGWSQSAMYNVEDVKFSPDGDKLIVSDGLNNRVLIWETIPSSGGGHNASVVVGQNNFTDYSSGLAANKLNYPFGILVTPNGRLLIADSDNNRVLVFNQIPTSNGASADIVIGQPNMTTNTPGSTANKLHTPRSIALSADGKLFISDRSNARILVYNKIPEQNGASADLVIGKDVLDVGGFDLNVIDEKSVGLPIGVSTSPSGMLAIGDFRNQRVLVYNQVPSSNGASADFVLGQPDFSQGVHFNNGLGATGTPSEYNMYSPYTISYDINDRLFVSGRDMNRVMVFGETPTEEAELTVSIAALNEDICHGAESGFVIKITNNGSDDATNVVISTAIPTDFPFTGYSASSGNYQFQGGEWLIPVVPNGQTDSLVVYGFVHEDSSSQEYTVYASIRSSNQRDPILTNNASSLTFTVESDFAPKVSNINDISSARNVVTNPVTFYVDFEGSESSVETYIFSSNTELVPTTNITITGTGTDRTLTITPAVDKAGYSDIMIKFTAPAEKCPVYRTFRVYFGDLWIGNTTEWGALGNWSRRIVPIVGQEAYIPSSPIGGNFPTMFNNNTVGSIVMEDGAGITISAGRTLTVQTLTLLGDANISGSGSISAHTINVEGSGSVNVNQTYINVTNSLVLDGVISLSANTHILIGTDAANTGSITHTSGRIVGEIRRWVAASTGSDIALPVGTADHNRWIIMNYSSAPTAGIISAHWTSNLPFNDSYYGNLPVSCSGTTIDNISERGVWRVRPADVSGVSGGVYNIQFNTHGIEEIADPLTLRMVKKAEGTDEWFVPGSHLATLTIDAGSHSYWVRRSGVNSFSYYALGGDFSENPLPIELLSFTAECGETGVVVKWVTASEINNDYFVLERSESANNWQIVKVVDGKGTVSTISNYSVFDPVIFDGVTYYQLTQNDFDGKHATYGPISVICEKSLAEKIVIHRLSHHNSKLNVLFSSPLPDVVVEVFDITGKPVYKHEYNGNCLKSGQYLEENLIVNPGLYMLRIYNKEEALVRKFMVR